MLRFLDSFDHYATDFAQKYLTTQVCSCILRARSAERSIPGGNPGLTQQFESRATWIVGFAFRLGRISEVRSKLAHPDAGSNQCELKLQAFTGSCLLQRTPSERRPGARRRRIQLHQVR
jgi:hypothetical protein